MSSLLRDATGRRRAVWRIVLFFLFFLLVYAGVGGALAVFATGMMVRSLLPSAVVGLVAALAASWWVTERMEGIPMASLGLPLDGLAGGELARGFALGALLIGLACLALGVTGAVQWRLEPGGLSGTALLGSLLRLTLFLFVAAWTEELLFRGYPLQAAAEAAGPTAAIGATAVVFALAHLANPGVASELTDGVTMAEILPLVNLGLAGVVLGLAYWRTYSLWFATGVHLGWNWVMAFLADLPVSGLAPGTPGYELFDTPGWSASLDGPDLWTGGAFGPEGGLAVTAAALLAIVWLLRTDRLGRSLRVRALRPLADRGRAEPGAARSASAPSTSAGGSR